MVLPRNWNVSDYSCFERIFFFSEFWKINRNFCLNYNYFFYFFFLSLEMNIVLETLANSDILHGHLGGMRYDWFPAQRCLKLSQPIYRREYKRSYQHFRRLARKKILGSFWTPCIYFHSKSSFFASWVFTLYHTRNF